MRHQIVALVEQLEAGPGRLPRMRFSDGEGGDQVAERLDHLPHKPDRGLGQRLELGVGFVCVREEPLEDLQQDLVADVEQVRHPGGERVADQGDVGVALRRADVGCHHRAGRLEFRAGLDQLLVLIEDVYELAEMGVSPVAARSLALLQNLIDRELRAGQVSHSDQFRPAEVRGGCLRSWRPDEQPVLAMQLGQVRETRLDGPVQVADRREVLAAGNDVPLVHLRRRPAYRGEASGVVQVHAFRALQEHEVPQRLLAEWQQCQLDAGRVVRSRSGQVRPDQVRRGANGGQHVLHEGQVQHLLGGDMRHLLPPA